MEPPDYPPDPNQPERDHRRILMHERECGDVGIATGLRVVCGSRRGARRLWDRRRFRRNPSRGRRSTRRAARQRGRDIFLDAAAAS